MDYKKGDVCSFLLKYQVEKWSEYTHTSIVKPTGSFYIPSDKLDDFYDLYACAVKHDEDLYVTEKHRDISPVLVDLDFRFKKEDDVVPKRAYTDTDVRSIVEIYVKNIVEYVDVAEFRVCVMQKPGPVVDKNVVKDGIHIVIPDIVTRSSVQFIIRKNVLNDCDQVFKNIVGLINPAHDIIDEAVIERNNWQMYGSKKPNCEKYAVTKVYKVVVADAGDYSMEEDTVLDGAEYVSLLSIRNKYDTTPLKIEKQEEVQAFEQELNQKKMSQANGKKKSNGILQSSQNMKKNTCESIEYVNSLVEILSIDRAEKYELWIRLGWCLRNIDHRMLDTWIEFSKKSPKFQDGEWDKLWNYMKEDGLGLGTLHMWARQDNPEQYKEIIKKDLSSLIFKSKNETHHDVANVVHAMYKHDFVCISIKHNLWYEFKNHRWVNCDSGHALRSRISTDVCREYMTHASYWSQKGSVDEDDTEQQRCAEIAKRLNGIALKLKQTAFKDNIMKECRELFYVDKFEERLDSKPHLVGFENGVYDLDIMEFREGRPEDFVSFSTGINYISYDEDSQHIKDINAFFSKVFTKAHIKDYVLKLLSSFLNGAIKEEKFHIWTGSGCFAKGTPVLMHSGVVKPVEDIVVGDVLVGDDSTPRTVQELFRGFSDMYRIRPSKGVPFEVNGEHIMVVKMNTPMVITKQKKKFVAVWGEKDEHNMFVECHMKEFDHHQQARQYLQKHVKSMETTIKHNDTIRLTVRQYMPLQKNFKKCMRVFRSSLVEYAPIEQDLQRDPYELGFSLTQQDRQDAYIPHEYKCNSKEVRLSILAGVVDSRGYYNRKTNQYEVTVKKAKQLVNDIVWVARSLGLQCYLSVNHKIYIVGDILHEFPVMNPANKAVKGKSSRDLLRRRFKVERIEDGDFYGFELDGNHLFVLGNGEFTVQSNSNGKSKTIDLFDQAFGEYCCKLPITLLTQKRAASNAATSELARTKGKRFACLQEPSEDEKLNVGLMKELTGGDKIMARSLYKEPIEFKPQTKMILTCNTLPNVPSDDGGTWRRIRVVEFTSKFCENPDPLKETEFLADFELSEKFAVWKEPFMSLLIEYHKKYIETGITEPDEVLQCTKEYQKNNDIFLEFIETEFERCEEDLVTYNDVLSSYKLWCKDNNVQPVSTKKREFIKAISRILGRTVLFNKIEGWKGWRFKTTDQAADDDLLDS